MNNLELEQRALEACGYRVHVKERNGTRWLMAVKGLGVRYEHWHPLTSINQAMQLLEERQELFMSVDHSGATVIVRNKESRSFEGWGDDLALSQCRAIVTACASLEPVR